MNSTRVTFTKALAEKLAESVDLTTLTVSKSAFKRFLATYATFAKAVGCNALKLRWAVVDGDLIATTPSGTHRYCITPADESHHCWLDTKASGNTMRVRCADYCDLFAAVTYAIYDIDLDATSRGCLNMLDTGSQLIKAASIAISGYSLEQTAAFYECLADAMHAHGKKKVELLVREIDRGVEHFKAKARNAKRATGLEVKK